MTLTREEVDDFHAQERGHENALAERIYWLERSGDEYVIEDTEKELARLKAEKADRDKLIRKLKRELRARK